MEVRIFSIPYFLIWGIIGAIIIGGFIFYFRKKYKK